MTLNTPRHTALTAVRVAVLAGAVLLLAAPAIAQQPSRPTSAAPQSDVVMVAATATQIAASDASRASLSCTNNDTVNAIRWGGDNTVAAAKGQRVGPGATFTVRGTYAVFGFPEAGTPTISCTPERF